MNKPIWSDRVRVNNFNNTELMQLAQLLARGFANSRFMSYMAGYRSDAMLKQQVILLNVLMRVGWVTAIFEAGAPIAVALWLPPGQQLPTIDYLLAFPTLLSYMGPSKVLRLYYDLVVISLTHTRHEVVLRNHVYLMEVVTDPAHRGERLSSELMHPVWAWCDQQGYMAYLESDNSDPTLSRPNQQLYESYGFNRTGVVPLWCRTLRELYVAMVRFPKRVST